ncbi:MAG: hypothetical protein ACREDV_09145 [Methylocella sp.]
MGPSFHPGIAVDANEETVPGLVDNFLLARQGGERDTRKQRDFVAKDSGRWLSGAESASAFSEAGAACATVFEDRESDVYECFAFKPANVEKLVRKIAVWPKARRISPKPLPGARPARWRWSFQRHRGEPRVAPSLRLSSALRDPAAQAPDRRQWGLPKTIKVTLVIGREVNPAEGEDPALWLLLTTYRVKLPMHVASSASIGCAGPTSNCSGPGRRKALMSKRCVRKQMDRSKSSSLRS